MATLEVDGLVTRLGELGLGPIPPFSEAHVLNKPLDIGRSYLAEILCSLTDCDPAVAYGSIQWPNDVFTADLTVPLPKLSRGAETKAFAVDLMKRVSKPSSATTLLALDLTMYISVSNMPTFHPPSPGWCSSSGHVSAEDPSASAPFLYQ